MAASSSAALAGAMGACGLMSLLSFSGVVAWTLLEKAAGKKKKSSAVIFEYSCLFLAAATMCADAFVHLLPEALELTTDAHSLGWTAFLGALSVVGLEASLEAFGGLGVKPFGIANLAVEAVHNVLDGIALGAAFQAGRASGLSATFAVALHELPQELGDFAVLKRAGFKSTSLILSNLAVSLTSFLGVLFANHMHRPTLLAFTAGSFAALSLHSIAPQALSALPKTQGHALWALTLVLLSGYALLRIADLEEDHHHDHHIHHQHHHDEH